MHGVLIEGSERWNARLGTIYLVLYAGLAYGRCQSNHQRHHRAEATHLDPDFHPDPQAGIIRWYLRFMAGYLSWGQMSRLLGGWAIIGVLIHQGHNVSWGGTFINVLVCCTVPLLLSSLQLFAFGTYLPHRGQRVVHDQTTHERPTAKSLYLPEWASLLTCYHFGYHKEHHEKPNIPWFALPRHRLASRDPMSVALDTSWY